MLADAGEGGVGVLLACVAGAEIVTGEEEFDALVLGAGDVTVLIHAKDEEIEERGFLFVRKTLCVHVQRVKRRMKGVNLRKEGGFITVAEGKDVSVS